MVALGITGPRPHKLGGYQAIENFKTIRRHMRDFLEGAPEGELTLISGGALGIDQFWIEVGLHLKLRVVAALPFEGYDAKWPVASRSKYEKLLAQCYQVLYISEPGYHPAKLQKRNEWVVDNCDTLVAYSLDGSGGTQNCIDYAGTQGRNTTVFDLEEILHA